MRRVHAVSRPHGVARARHRLVRAGPGDRRGGDRPPDPPGPSDRVQGGLRLRSRRTLGARQAHRLRRRGSHVPGVPRRGAGRGRHPGVPAVPRVRGLARDDGGGPRRGCDVRGGTHRRPPRHVRPGQDGGAGAGGQHPVLHRRDDVAVQDPAGRFLPALARRDPAHHRHLGHRSDQRREPDRRARRAGGRRRRHRRGSAGDLRREADRAGTVAGGQHRPAGGHDRLWHLPRLPAVQLQPGSHLHGRRRRALPRAPHGGVDDGDRRAASRRRCRSAA